MEATALETAAFSPAGRDSTPRADRLVSLDAFRGAIMLLMASSGLGFARVAGQFPDSRLWRFLGEQTEHAAWTGCTLWGLIQPSFLFMVGTALAWSMAKRRERGDSPAKMFTHALWRSLVLILLAVFLTSAWSERTEWIFTNVLAQIGLGYPFLFLLAFTRLRTQWVAAFAILTLYWLAFALHPAAPPGFAWQTVGIPESWPHLQGFAGHWGKNFNFAATFDRWFLNLFPRQAPFTHSTGGYQTLNFIPSLATMIFGLIAGQWLRQDQSCATKVKGLAIAGVAGVLVGWLLALLGICPIVKRIWTPAWTIYSAGWVSLLLAGFVAVIDWRGWRKWAFPLVVAGLNPITLYCLWQLTGGFIRENFKRHFSPDIFELLGSAYAPVLERLSILLILWLILFVMFRKRIFVRI
jgi:predicted acyltransferase